MTDDASILNVSNTYNRENVVSIEGKQRMKRSLRIVSVLLLLSVVSGCATSGSSVSTNEFVRSELKKHEN